MVNWIQWGLLFILRMLPFFGVALAILYAGFIAYDTRLKREAHARRLAEAPPRPDPVAAFKTLNDQIEREYVEARHALAKARETVERGTQG